MVKYLSYIHDDQLNCNKIAANAITKLNNILSTFRKIRSSLSLKASITVLKAKFIPYIDYITLFSYLISKKDFKKRRYLTLMLYMYKKANQLPYEKPTSNTIATRSSFKRNFQIVRPNNSRYERLHLYQGQLLWNDLPLEHQRLPDIIWLK